MKPNICEDCEQSWPRHMIIQQPDGLQWVCPGED